MSSAVSQAVPRPNVESIFIEKGMLTAFAIHETIPLGLCDAGFPGVLLSTFAVLVLDMNVEVDSGL